MVVLPSCTLVGDAPCQSSVRKLKCSMKHIFVFGSGTETWDLQDLDVMPRAELSELQLPKIVRERGQMGVEHVQAACPKNVNTSEEDPCSRKRGRSEGATGLDHREDNTASSTGFSYWIIKSRHLLQKIELLNKSRRQIDQEEVTREHPILASSGVIQVSLPRAGPTSRLIENRSLAVASSTTCKWLFQLFLRTFFRKHRNVQ